MKKLLMALALLTSVNSFAGISLYCSSDMTIKNNDNYVVGAGRHLLLGGEFKTDCKDRKGNDYSIVLEGVGPGLEFVQQDYVVVTCPTVNKKRLNSRGKVVLGAVNISASAVIGVTAGVSINHRGGACLISGFTAGVGVSIKVGFMKIMAGSLNSNGIELVPAFL